MFKRLKELLLNEISEQAEYADKVYREIVDLEKELNSLYNPEYEFLLFEPSNPDKQYSNISKFLMFKKYKQAKKEYEYKKEEYDNKKLKKENEEKEYKLRKVKLEERIQ